MGSRRLIGFLAFAAGLTAAFSLPLVSLAKYAATVDLHSHIVLIPFLSAYLLFIRRKDLPREYVRSPGWTVLLLIAGIAALIAVTGVLKLPLSHNDSLSFTALSFICLLAAGGFLFLGQMWMRAAAFPFAFLIFMVPLPDGLVNWLETASKLASAEAAALFFQLTGTPCRCAMEPFSSYPESSSRSLRSAAAYARAGSSSLRACWHLICFLTVPGDASPWLPSSFRSEFCAMGSGFL